MNPNDSPAQVACDFEHPSRWQTPDANLKVTKLLKEGAVIEKKSMREVLSGEGKRAEFDNNVWLVKLDNKLSAVFKPEPAGDLTAYVEVAAYRASVELGFPYVPPTVLRTIDGEQGSLQLFIKTQSDLLIDDEYKQFLKDVHEDDLDRLKIFYFVFGQWDTGPHNLLLFKDGGERSYPIAIDNAGIANLQQVQYGELPFVRVLSSGQLGDSDDHDRPFPFDQAKTVENPTKENLSELFGQPLPDEFYRSFNWYGKRSRYVIYRNSLWRQYHAFDDGFVRSYTPRCPEGSRAALEKLTLDRLKQIFSATPTGSDCLSDAHLNAILGRRDTILQHFNAITCQQL
jgi:hypothetical protein